MAGFRKARAEQAALKMSMYGAQGTGKTLTALLVAEGLARVSATRIAYVDTEHGTDFYSIVNPARAVHPEAFDFDALYTRSLTDVLAEVKKLRPAEHGVIVLDSITHLWDAAMAAYSGGKTRAGTIPIHAWSKIKAPYKDLMHHLINSPQHVLILGRQRVLYEEDEISGESKAAGVGMRAEGETQYEPHICLRMESLRPRSQKGAILKHGTAVIAAFAEKDRTGTLQGKLIEWPNFEKIAGPLLGLLGQTQAVMQSDAEVAARDSDVIEASERERAVRSRELLRTHGARLELASTLAEVKLIGKEITPELKREMINEDLAKLRSWYLGAETRVSGADTPVIFDEPKAKD